MCWGLDEGSEGKEESRRKPLLWPNHMGGGCAPHGLGCAGEGEGVRISNKSSVGPE